MAETTGHDATGHLMQYLTDVWVEFAVCL